MTLTATDIHERLDTAGLLSDSRGPGAYALRVDTPADRESVARAWLSEVDAALPHEAFARLSRERVAYVGGSKDVYSRLQDHGDAQVRQATFLEVFDAVDLLDVWPADDPFRAERRVARELSRDGWAVWTDGELW